MKKEYEYYTDITKEILDTIKVGDLIKINDWKKPLRVKGVSENYFVMNRAMFKDYLYSVCEKKQWGGIMHNSMLGEKFHCGTDNLIFGSAYGYKFDKQENVDGYLYKFENGEMELSHRTSCPINEIYIKRM